MDEHRWTTREQTAFLVVAVAIVLLRIGFVVATYDSLRDDPDAYASIANCLSEFGVYGQAEQGVAGTGFRPTAFRPPLYPVLLALVSGGQVVRPLAVAWLHTIVGILTVGITCHLGNQAAGRRAALVALVLVGADPLLLQQSTLIMTETVATFLSIVVLWFLHRYGIWPSAPRAISAGITVGLACLARPTFLPLASLVLIGFLIERGRASDRVAFRVRMMHAVLFCLGVAGCVGPWVWRNKVTFGHPIAATTHGGYTLLLGNNPSFYRYLQSGRLGEPWDASDFHDAWQRRDRCSDPQQFWTAAGNPIPRRVIRSEVEDDQFAYQVAKSTIQSDLRSFIRSCGLRIAWFWRPVPQRLSLAESWSRTIMRCAVGIWYSAVLAGAGRALWLFRRELWHSPWVWGMAMVITFTAVHTLYWSNIRMRAPLIPFIAILAGAGIADKRSKYPNSPSSGLGRQILELLPVPLRKILNGIAKPRGRIAASCSLESGHITMLVAVKHSSWRILWRTEIT